MHFLYCITLIFYTKNAIMFESEDQIIYGVILAIGVMYPAAYELTQLYKTGAKEYL